MISLWPILLSFLSALLYVGSVLSVKRASDLGAGLWQSTFATNIAIAIAFQGTLLFGGNPVSLGSWWQPVLVASLFMVGQTLTMYSVRSGDVTIATPVLGLKIVLVALFTTLVIARGLPWQIWTAAILATLGIVALNHPGAHQVGANAKTTIVSAGMAASAFALFDVLVQKWSPAWGMGRFLPITMIVMALLSCTYLRMFEKPFLSMGRPALKWLVLGCAFFSVQTVTFVSTIAYFGGATAMNVVYSSRGLLSLLAVNLIGHWFHSTEKDLGPQVLRWRFAGAALMFTAIILVLLSGPKR